MDYVKREDQNLIDEESYKAYTEALQKQTQQMDIDYQHTSISMEQLHQAMQSSLSGSLAHNFQIPLSPRQMSTLMLKTNHLTRNIHFNDIPAHLPRNLTAEIELAQNLANEIGGAHLTHSLARNHPEDIRSLANEIELHHAGLAQNLHSISEQMDLSRSLAADMSNLSQIRNMTNMNHEIDLSQHVSRSSNIEQELLDESRRTPIVCVPETILGSHSLGVHDAGSRLDQEHLLPMPFNIKAEQEDEGYFYDTISHGFNNNMNGLGGQMPLNSEASQSSTVHQDNQMYAYSTHNISNINTPTLAAIDLYTRPQTYIQNYSANISRDNPQNLVMHRQFENHSPYPQEEFKRFRQDGADSGGKTDSPKLEEPKENLKPSENKIKMYCPEFSQNIPSYAEKNENDSSEHNKLPITKDDSLTMSIKGEYACYKCNDIFPTKRGLKQHTKSCSDIGDSNVEITEKAGKFCCTLCSYRCQSPAILKIHERTHTGEKPFSCTFCDYKSGQKNNVAKHILVHMKEKPFRCQYCEYRCAQKNNLVVHERTHTGHKPFACPYCDYRTVQKPNLVKHMYLHTDQKPFSCDICSYRCVQKTNLTKHKQRHLNEKEGDKIELTISAKPYRPRQKSVKCPHCPYRCVQKSSLDKHMQFKHADTNQLANAEFSQENFETGLNLMKNAEDSIQNLSVKKDAMYAGEAVSPGKLVESLQIQS